MTSKNDDYPKVTYNEGVTAKPTGSSEHQLLMQAISTCAGQLVQQLIQKNPQIVHERGWHGQTALHKACLIGDYSMCFILLDSGADPNAPNDFDETPLHYACKRGVPTVIHLLVQKGGNLDCVDKNGMSMCHHAAQTGSVFALIYLYTLRPSYPQVNKQFQLPLHIACHFGHVDAFRYLLKKEKSDLKQADADGNNVLHIAAREGHQGLCWDILKTTCGQVIHAENNDGYTPADLASQRDKYGHKVIAPILRDLKKHKPLNFMVTDPRWLWYWTLLKPFLIYLFLLILITIFDAAYGEGYQGFIMIVGVCYLLWTMSKNIHRLDHISRMPNPVFAGAFGAGLVHTTAHYWLYLSPLTGNYTTLSILSVIIMIITYYMYYLLLTRNPGVVTQSKFDSVGNRRMTIVDLCIPQQKLDDYCTFCEIVKPVRTKHCRLCEQCFEEMDHHCLFLLKCVAKNNHVLFIWFLIVCVLSMIIYEIHITIYISMVTIDITWGRILYILFYDDAWTFSLALANAVSILWGLNLIRFQLSVVSKGQLTAIHVYTKKQSALTTEEKFWNIINFLRFRPPYAKDPYLAAQNLIQV
ncbi:ZDHHC13_17 [Mytilus coruscus]|uniref:Palmitoyltransferase n=1 Tax=Mytilus coruscus TaxID=42192 RepID=A0A6J8AHN9_MYTCO|nr:ZDHHC13_17 [Mytilus coruscus]